MNESLETPMAVIDKDLNDVKTTHERLYRQVCEQKVESPLGDKERSRLLAEVGKLLDQMGQLVPRMTHVHHFRWLSEATTQWQIVYTEVFNIPEDIREKVGVVSLDRTLTPAPSPISEGQIESFLQRTAGEISQSRKLTALYEQFEYLQHHRNAIHAVIRSSTDEMRQDWYNANVCLASDALAGKTLEDTVDFTRAYEPSMLGYLERVWLDDVKRLRAYRAWYQGGHRWDEHPERYYLNACDELRKLVLDKSIKAPASARSAIRDYVKTRYLSQGHVRPNPPPAAKELIRVKAHRLSLLRKGDQNAETNWLLAEEFVVQYYQNILAAVMDQSTTATRAVMQAIRSRHGLVNAFEAALCIYFLHPDTIQASGMDLGHLI